MKIFFYPSFICLFFSIQAIASKFVPNKEDCPVISITLQPNSPTVCMGAEVTLSANATGADSYLWQEEIATGQWENLSGGGMNPTGEMVSVTISNINQTKTVRCLFTNCSGEIFLATQAVILEPKQPQITVQPTSQTYCKGNIVPFSLSSPTGTSFTWYRKILTDADFIELVASTNVVITNSVGTSELKIRDIGSEENPHLSQYYCLVRDVDNCAKSSEIVTLYVNSLGEIADTTPICAGGSAKFATVLVGEYISIEWQKGIKKTPTTYSFTKLDENPPTVVGTNTPTLSLSNIPYEDNNTYYRVVVLFKGSVKACQRTSTNNEIGKLTVNPLPLPPNTNATSRCGEGEITVSAEGVVGKQNYKWYADDNSLSPYLVKDVAEYSTTIGVSTDFYASIYNTDTQCESERVQARATVHPLPTIELSEVAAICNSQSYFDLPYTAYSWAETYTIFGENPAISGFSPPIDELLPASPIRVVIPENTKAATYQFNFRVKNKLTNCESVDYVFPLEIKQIPAVPEVSSIVDACQQEILTPLTASGIGTIVWYGSDAVGGMASLIPPTPSSEVLGNTNFYVAQRDEQNCESNRAVINVAIHPNPPPPLVASEIAYCQNAVASALTANYSEGNSLLWYDSEDNLLEGAPIPTTAIAGIQTFKVSQKSPPPANCESPKSVIKVTVHPNPEPPVVTSPIGYCQNEKVNPLTATATGTLVWYENKESIGTNAAPTPKTANAGTSSYYVSQKDANLCESERATIEVIITPTLSVSIEGNAGFCASGEINKTAQLSAKVIGGDGNYSYQWSQSTGEISGATDSSYGVNSSNQSSPQESYQVKVISGSCSAISGLKTVGQTALLDENISVTGIDVSCGGTATLLVNTTNPFGLFRWYSEELATEEVNEGTISGTRHEKYLTPALYANTSYFVAREFASLGVACQSKRFKTDVVVHVPNPPKVSNSAGKTSFCTTESAFSLTPTCEVGTAFYRLNSGNWENVVENVLINPPNFSSSTSLNYDFKCVVENCESNSTTIAITINGSPSIKQQPTDQTNCKGLGVTFSAILNSSANLQWQSRTTVLSNFTDVGTSTNNTAAELKISNVGSSTNPNNLEFRLKIEQDGCVSYSSAAVLHVNSVSGTIPSVTKCVGESVTWDLTSLTIVGNLVNEPYQWEVSPTSGTSGITDIAGAKEATFTINPIEAKDGNQWYRPKLTFTNTVSGSCSLRPTAAKLSVTELLPPTILSDKTLICEGEVVALTATECAGEVLWSDGRTSTSINVSPNESTVYTATCTQGDCTSLPSNQVLIEINSRPISPTIIGELNICEGKSTTLVANNCAGIIVWSSGETASSIQVNPNLTTTYSAICSVDACSSLKTKHTLSVNPKPTVPTNTTLSPICEGNTLFFSTSEKKVLWYNTMEEEVGSSVAPSFSSVGKYNVFVSQVDENQCESNRLEVFGEILAKPATPVAVPTSICKGQSVQLQIENICDGILKWYEAEGKKEITMPISPMATMNYFAKCLLADCESEESNWVTVTVNEKPLPPVNTTPESSCEGNTLVFSAEGNKLSWYNSATGGTATNLALSYSATGTYQHWVSQTDEKGCESERLLISATVSPNPTILTQPVDQTDCKGNGVSFSIKMINSSETLLYQWQRKRVGESDFSPIEGATAANLSISSIGDANNPHLSEYRCAITSNACSIISEKAVLFVNSLVGSLPSQTVCEKENVHLDLSNFTSTGTISSYQWQKRQSTSGSWTDILSATDSQLDLNLIQKSEEGYYRGKLLFKNDATHTCVIYTSSGNGTKITVNSKPNLPTNTTPENVCLGNTLTFSAVGTQLLWYDAAEGGIGSSVAPQYSEAGVYIHYVSQTLNSCESERLLITATLKNTASNPPVNTTPTEVCKGEALFFSASGTNLLWYDAASGGTASTLAPRYTDAGTYTHWVSATNDACESERLKIEARIQYLKIDTQPIDQTDCKGNGVSFSIKMINSSETLLYQWQRKRVGESDFSPIEGANAANLSISNIADTNNPHLSEYRCVITSNACSIISEKAVLFVNSLVGSLPSQSVCENENVHLDLSSFTSTGTVVIYQWQKRVGTSGSWTDIPLATDSKLDLNLIQKSEEGYYRCKLLFMNDATHTCVIYTSVSNGTKITVNSKPPLPTNTTPESVCLGNTLTFSAVGTQLLWYEAAEGGLGSSVAPQYSEAGVYTHYVSQTLNSCESERLLITSTLKNISSNLPVNTTPTTVCKGDTLIFSANGTNLLWYDVVSGGTTSTLSPRYTEAGTYIHWVSATNDGCESERLKIEAKIQELKIDTQPVDQTDCKGNGVSFSIKMVNSNETLLYQWQRKRVGESDFSPIEGANAANLSISGIGDANNPHLSEYRCAITSNACSIISEKAVLLVNSLVGSLPSQTVCEEENVHLDLSNFTSTGTVVIYQWQKRIGTSGSWMDISSATDSKLDLNPIQKSEEGYYRCKLFFKNDATHTCVIYTSISNGTKITVNSKPTLPTNTTPESVCLGNTLTFSAVGNQLLWYEAATCGIGSSVAPNYSDAGVYTHYVSQTQNSCESERLLITATIKNTTSNLPINTTPTAVCKGDRLIFSASGTNLLWYSSASGGTASSIPPHYTEVGTYTHWVSATNDGCESERLKIEAKIQELKIDTQPIDPTDCKGNSVSFTVETSVGAAHQWQRKRPDELDFSNVSDEMTGIQGALRNKLTLTSLGIQNPDSTQFRVLVTAEGVCPPLYSTQALLHVNSLKGNLPNLTTCVGGSLGLDLLSHFKILGKPTRFQWQKRAGTSGEWTELSDGEHYLGSSTSNLQLLNLRVEESAYYRCAVSFEVLPEGSSCIEYTDPSHLLVGTFPPAPAVIPSYEFCQFSKASRIIVYGDKPFKVLYYSEAEGGVGSTKSIVPNTQTAGTFDYFVAQQSKEGCESPRSKIKIVIHPLPASPINTTPTHIQENSSPLIFSAKGSHLQWYSSKSDRTASLDAPIFTKVGTHKAFVSQIDENGCESPRVEIIAMIVPSLKISKQPLSQTDCKGNSVTFSLTTKGNNAAFYQWQRKRPDEIEFVDLPNETSNSLTIRKIGNEENPHLSVFRCLVKDQEGSLTSSEAVLYVNSVLGKLTDFSICEGQKTSLNLDSLTITGNVRTYQWQKRRNTKEAWADFSTNKTHVLDSLTRSDSAQYRMRFVFYITEKQSCVINSDILTLKVNEKPIEPTVESVQYCQNSKAVGLKASALKSHQLGWWESLEDTLAQAKAIVPRTDSAGIYSYFVSQNNKYGCESKRAELKVTINPLPEIQVQNRNYCLGEKTQALEALVSENVQLEWYTSEKATKKLAVPIYPESKKVGNTSYFVLAKDSLGCQSPRQELKISILNLPKTPLVKDLEYCPNTTASALSAFTEPQNQLFWYDSATATQALMDVPVPKTNEKAEFSYFVLAKDSAGCESAKAELKVKVVSCVANFENNFGNCTEVSLDSVEGSKWFDFYDEQGNLYASIHPKGQNLGKVTAKMIHFGENTAAVLTENKIQLMPRYFDFQSSLLNKFEKEVSLKIYFNQQELERYREIIGNAGLRLEDLHLLHYDGTNENCSFQDNDNFEKGESLVIHQNIIAENFRANGFYLEFRVSSFSEIGTVAKDFFENIQFSVKRVGEKALIQWQTKDENKLLKYTLQRSANKKHWINVEEQPAQGIPNATYEISDYQVFSQTNHYRLLVMNKDGIKKFHSPVSVDFNDVEAICRILPNPVTSHSIQLYVRNIQPQKIEIYSITGKKVNHSSLQLNEKEIIELIPHEKLQALHFVLVQDEHGKKCVNKFFVK